MRIAQRSLTLRPAHSRGHLFVTRYPKASDISSPPCLLRSLPAGAMSPGGPCTHWKAPPCHGAPPKPTFPPARTDRGWILRSTIVARAHYVARRNGRRRSGFPVDQERHPRCLAGAPDRESRPQRTGLLARRRPRGLVEGGAVSPWLRFCFIIMPLRRIRGTQSQFGVARRREVVGARAAASHGGGV